MTTWSRTDTSLVGRWWWTVDRWLLTAVVGLCLAGIILTLAASPAVAERLGKDTFYFAHRQMFFIALALAVMVIVSFSATAPAIVTAGDAEANAAAFKA